MTPPEFELAVAYALAAARNGSASWRALRPDAARSAKVFLD